MGSSERKLSHRAHGGKHGCVCPARVDRVVGHVQLNLVALCKTINHMAAVLGSIGTLRRAPVPLLCSGAFTWTSTW